MYAYRVMRSQQCKTEEHQVTLWVCSAVHSFPPFNSHHSTYFNRCET